MTTTAQVYYLEVVTADVEQVCASYTASLGVTFSDAVMELGGAYTASLSDGGFLGVRAPMHEAEEPTTRPYYLVADIDQAVQQAADLGAQVAVPPMDIPGRGKCAVLMYGTIQSGLWQV